MVGNIKSEIEYKLVEGEILSGAMLDEKGNFKSELKAGSLGAKQEEITNFSLKEKWIFEDVIEYDSEFEKEIIINDENRQEITIFAKMPKLEILTPIGKYNPDFCYLLEKEDKKKLFLIVESKGFETEAQIPQNEKDKIYKQLKEIETFKQKIDELLKEGYNPILDDGVGKNIAPLQKKKMLAYEVLNDGQLKKYLNADW